MNELSTDTQMGMLSAASPADLVKSATTMANNLAPIIEDKKLFTLIGGKKHVHIEGWTTLAAMCGLAPQEVSNEELPDGRYVATAELIRISNGQVLCRASSECGAPDEDYWGKPSTEGRQAPRYAVRSMAATRAVGKACRLLMSWIMVLGGYAATPAEEMTGVAGAAAKGACDSGGGTLTFGKHKGSKWSDVPSAYLEWLIGKTENQKYRDLAQSELDRRKGVDATGRGKQGSALTADQEKRIRKELAAKDISMSALCDAFNKPQFPESFASTDFEAVLEFIQGRSKGAPSTFANAPLTDGQQRELRAFCKKHNADLIAMLDFLNQSAVSDITADQLPAALQWIERNPNTAP